MSWRMLLPRGIAAQVDYLLSNSPLPIQVDSFRKGHDDHSFADRFSVLFPCFRESIRWEIVYSCQNPCWPPDVIFAAQDADFQPLASSSSICCMLKNWDAKDPSQLLKLLAELRTEYLQYQQKRVQELKDSRLHFEISTLQEIEGLEMGLLTEEDGARVILSIPLHGLDLSKLARECRVSLLSRNSGILLQVCCAVREADASYPPQMKLHGPDSLKEVLKLEDVTLPSWTENMCLTEYVPKLQDLLRSQIADACTSLILRRNFIEALVPVFGRPLEADTDFCKKVSIVASSGNFTFLVHISISIQFPRVQPVLLMQSSQHFDAQGRPMSRTYVNYPWSPRWDVNEMASRICDFVSDENTAFKQHCNDNLQYQ